MTNGAKTKHTNKGNRFSRYVSRINKMPLKWRSYLLTKLFCSQVKFAGTAKVKLVSVNSEGVELFLHNRKKVQNHIGGIHAIAAGLLAESASGIAFGMHVPDSHLPLLKSMKMNFNRRMQGNLKALAHLTTEQIAQVTSEEKGDIEVFVQLIDDSGQEPIDCTMNWAWVPKKRK